MIQEAKDGIDGDAHYQIEIYRSKSVTIIANAKTEIENYIQTTIHDYRVQLELNLEVTLQGLDDEFGGFKVYWLAEYDRRK